MPQPARPSPVQMVDEATFHCLCRILGSTGNSEQRKRERGNALAQLKAIPAPERQALFARVWKRETTRRRRQVSACIYGRYYLVAIQVLALSVMGGFSLYQHSLIPLIWSAPITFIASVINMGFILLGSPLPRVQRGMARLLLRQEPEIGHGEIGYLVDVIELPFSEQEVEEILRVALRHLTRLLPTLDQTDATFLDLSHRRTLRRWVVRAGYHLTNPKLHTLRGADADFAAAALVALGATGGWQETTREARNAAAAVRKLADAAPMPDEPLNHRYVRELAREALPQLPVGKR